jgi:hypothetical protein
MYQWVLARTRFWASAEFILIALRKGIVKPTDEWGENKNRLAVIDFSQYFPFPTEKGFAGILNMYRISRKLVNYSKATKVDLIITDNEFRFHEFCLFECQQQSIKVVLEHGLRRKERGENLRSYKVLARRILHQFIFLMASSSLVNFSRIVFRIRSALKPSSDRVDVRRTKFNLHLFSTISRLKELSGVTLGCSGIIFFSSGAFSYNDMKFIRETIAAYESARCYAKERKLDFYIKLKLGEERQFKKMIRLSEEDTLLDQAMDTFEILSTYKGVSIVAPKSSTVAIESYLAEQPVWFYEANLAGFSDPYGNLINTVLGFADKTAIGLHDFRKLKDASPDYIANLLEICQASHVDYDEFISLLESMGRPECLEGIN